MSRIFLDPKQPLLDAVAQRLLTLGPSLRHAFVVVPTSNSGRRLRRLLPQLAGKPILTPRFVTPDHFFRQENQQSAAPKSWHLAAWAKALLTTDLESLIPLYPQLVDERRTYSWAFKQAQQFIQLKDELAEVDLDLNGPIAHSEEAHRWVLLEALDQVVQSQLHEWGWLCPSAAKRQFARDWTLPNGYERLIIAAVSDAVPLSCQVWSRLQEKIPCEVWIHADASLADQFDDWGRPRAEFWSQIPLHLPSEASQVISRHATPRECASAVVNSCVNLTADSINLGVLDSSLTATVQEIFSEHGWPLFDPNGHSLSQIGWWHFLSLWRDFLLAPQTFQLIPKLLKSPEFVFFFPSSLSPYQLAIAIDQLQRDFLPTQLTQAIHKAEGPLKQALQQIHLFAQEAQNQSPSALLRSLIEKLSLSPRFPEEVKSTIAESLKHLSLLESVMPEMQLNQAFELFFISCQNARITNELRGTVLDQLGWLELPYHPAPHLRLVGFHEGAVPDRPDDDGWLTDALRRKLGLRDRQQRLARDSYLFHSLLEPRKVHGSVRIFLSLTTPSGEARTASRLLLRCPEAELPERIRWCFPESLETTQHLPPFTRGSWILQLPENTHLKAELVLSPVKVSTYLRCPFRFFLKYAAGFETKNFGQSELNPMDFGNVLHECFDQFFKFSGAADLSNSEEISDTLEAIFAKQFTSRYGDSLSLSLRIQREQLRQRLRAMAQHQAKLRQEGWRMIASEWSVSPRSESSWSCEGVPFSLRIDRIDQHLDTGALLLIDYKSSKSPKKPQDQHLRRALDSDAAGFCYAPLVDDGKTQKRWNDLQLPIYAEVIRAHFKTTELPEVAYFNLPMAASEAGISVWRDYDESLHENAMQWLSGIVKAIKNQEFPIRSLTPDQLKFDDFQSLAPDSLEEAFAIHSTSRASNDV